MVFGSKRETKPDAPARAEPHARPDPHSREDALPREEAVGNLYSEHLTREVEVAQSPGEFRREDRGNESVIDPHARFNGKYVSDRDLRIEGEAQGEIECQGTLVISPQARVRSAIKAHNVIVNGDYEGDVDCGGRFEVGSTGRVKGNIKTQVLVIKEGAHMEGGVVMTREPGPRPAMSQAHAPSQMQGQGMPHGQAPAGPPPGRPQGQPAGAGAASGGSVFGKGEREREAAIHRQPAGQGGGGQ
jgi:cytoskeletal protein CcmA (bactofilin family)